MGELSCLDAQVLSVLFLLNKFLTLKSSKIILTHSRIKQNLAPLKSSEVSSKCTSEVRQGELRQAETVRHHCHHQVEPGTF